MAQGACALHEGVPERIHLDLILCGYVYMTATNAKSNDVVTRSADRRSVTCKDAEECNGSWR